MSTATEPTIEQRLAALEVAMAAMRQQLEASAETNWLERVIGSMKDEPAFAEVVALGRAFRQADRPPHAEEMMGSDPAGGWPSSNQHMPPSPSESGPVAGEPNPAERTTGGETKRAKLDDQGRLIPLTPAEMQAEAEAIRVMLDEIRAIPNDPNEDDAEFFRAMDSHCPERPLFDGLY